MEMAGWKPLDLVVGGMLTAGVAFGVYKLGANRRGTVVAAELDATSLQECIALAGRPSELEVSILPQSDAESRRLAASLAKSIQASHSGSHVEGVLKHCQDDVIQRTDVNSTNRRSMFREDSNTDTSGMLLRRFSLDKTDSVCSSPDGSPPKRCRRFHPDSYSSPLMVDRTPPELTRQLQSYRDILDKWTADSEAKIEKLEQQRMSLATELHVTREALQAERRHRAEAEQRRQRAEIQLKELETRLQRCSESQEEASRQEDEMRRQEQQVRDMEEQLENLYLNNIVTPRHAVQQNVAQQEQLSQSLQQAEHDLEKQQQDLEEMDNEITNLSAQLNKARKDGRQLGEDNAMLEKQLHGAQKAARDMVALLYERSVGKDWNTKELTELLNAPDSDIPLDQLLQCVTALIVHS